MRSLRLMTYNVRYFGHGTGGLVSTRTDLRSIADAIAAMTPLCDVIALQEIEDHSLRSALVTWHPTKVKQQLTEWMSDLARALERRGIAEAYDAHYFPAHRYALTKTTHLYTTGLAVLVGPRLEVVSDTQGRIEDITHRRGAKSLKQTRICAHLTLRLRDGHRVTKGENATGDLDVFNTHLSLPGPFYREFWSGAQRLGFGPNQLQEAQRLARAIERRRRSPRVVLMGDFNSLPGSQVDRLLQTELGLVDALATSNDFDETQRAAWPTAGFFGMRMAIDRIYASPGIVWTDFDGSAPFESHSPFHGLSDHVPIVGRMHLA